MDPQLQRALDALQQAHAAGNEEDARQIAEYVKLLQEQQQDKAMLEGSEESMMRNPVAAGAAGAVAGPVVGKVLQTAYGPGSATPVAAPSAPSMAGAPGQKYAAKTGYGAGPGETVREVVEEFKKQEGPLGKGKVTSKIKGGPLGGPAAMEQIAAKEADAARFAQMRAANQIAAQKATSVPSRVAQATAGKMPLLMKSAAGAGTGLQASDAYNRAAEGDYLGAGIGAIGAAGSAASLFPHPITRIGGTAIGIGAGALNQYLDYLKSKSQQQPAPAQQPQPMAQGGLAHFAKGGGTTPAWQRKEGKSPEGGLNAAGRASYNRETGGNLKPPVSAEAAKSSPKKAARRKSFCARMSGNPGPMKDEKGRPTRKALALSKWDC